MKKFVLTSDMLTGIDDIDNQHRKLLSWGNDLCFDDTEASVNKIEEVLNNLTRYVSYHFRAEEEAMNRYRYKMLGKHSIQHERLMFDVAKLVVRSKKEGVSHALLMELQDMLIDWFRYHIQEWDRPFATFVKNNNLLTSFSLIGENGDYDWSEIDLT